MIQTKEDKVSVCLSIDKTVLARFDKARGIIPRSALIRWLMEAYSQGSFQYIDQANQPFPFRTAHKDKVETIEGEPAHDDEMERLRAILSGKVIP